MLKRLRPLVQRVGFSSRLVPLLISAFLVVMGGLWLIAMPPASGPDEGAHYIKAIGVGRGELYGQPVSKTAPDLRALFGLSPKAVKGLGRASTRWQAGTTREFRVPLGLMDRRFGCMTGTPGVSAACLSRPSKPETRRVLKSFVGTYQPYVYVPAGLAIRAANNPSNAIRLGRLAMLLPALALLVAATWLLWTPAAPGASLLGLAVAITPMVLFIAANLSPSGPEVAGAICFAAALLRLARAEPPPRWVWVALGASGAVLATARALGPAFVVVLFGSAALLAGPRTLARALRSGGARAAAAGVVILVAMAAGVVWEFAYQPRPAPSGTSVLDALGPSFGHLPDIGKMAIGVFGKLDAPMPKWGIVVWALLLVVLIAAALVAGGTRERLSVLGALLGIVVVVMVMSVVYREIGPMQGRYAMPVLVLVPLWMGEVVLRRRDHLPSAAMRGLVAAVFASTLAVHVLGLWAASRRFAVGDGLAWRFFSDAAWSPPLGWWPWVVCTVAAACAYLAAGALALAPARAAAAAGPEAAGATPSRGQPRRRSTA
jgi:predicted membrane protein DUF2142